MTHNPNRAPLGGPAAWTGAELERDQSWIKHLGAPDIAALDRALDHVRQRGLGWAQVSRADFPLGDFGAHLADMAEELENGRGIALLRGLPVERYDAEALKCIHYGLACHLGTPVYQSARGELIGEITDEGAAALSRGTLEVAGDEQPFLSSRARVQTTGALRFHTDRADVVALLCVDQSMSGGLSEIASAITIHDTMLARRPDLVEALYGDIPRSRSRRSAARRRITCCRSSPCTRAISPPTTRAPMSRRARRWQRCPACRIPNGRRWICCTSWATNWGWSTAFSRATFST
jgi:hypothetical protein